MATKLKRHGIRRRWLTTLDRLERLEARVLLDGGGLDVEWPSFSARVDAIYAPDTPAEIVNAHAEFARAAQANGQSPSPFTFGDGDRWSYTASDGFISGQGEATTITWSIVPDGTATVNDSNGGLSGQSSNLIARMDAIYNSSSESVMENKVWFGLLDSVFNRWSDVSGIDFVYEANDDGVAQSSSNSGQIGVRGDIRLAGHDVDGNSNVLAYNYFPNFGEMVIDTNDSFYTNTSNNSLLLRNVVAHEAGHGLGISHVEPVNATKLMEPFLTSAFDGPQFDDILAVNRGYGDKHEQGLGNDTANLATDLANLGVGQTIVVGGDAADTFVNPVDTEFISIDDNSDVDFFRFTTTEPAAANVTLRPTGPTYQSGPQGGSATTFNAQSQSDLTVAILDVDGATVLAAANATGLGQIELLANIALPVSGEYFVRITGVQNATQFYQLDVMLDSLTVQIVDNGDSDFSSGSSWSRWTGQGYQGDIHEDLPGSGTDVASWTFSDLLPGQYQVAASWSAYSNRASNAPFEIYDGGNKLATVRVNQQLAANDFTEVGVGWEQLGGTHVINGTELIVQLTDDANGRLNADAIRIERLGDPVLAPEIQVHEGTVEIADGSGSVSFGSTSPGTPLSKTFTVGNVGTQELTLSEPITVPTGFSVTSSFGTTTLAANASTTFVVKLESSSEGTFSGELSFTNNDDDESPFNFNLSGSVATVPPPPAVQIVDNGDSDFSSGSSWSRWTGQGYQGDIHEDLPGSGTDVASWTFSDLLPGQYQVAASWSAYSNRASNAPFEIYDGGNKLATVRVNQQLAANDFTEVGVGWEQLGGTHVINGTELIVQLTDDANGRLNADAIRIERLGDPVLAGVIFQNAESGIHNASHTLNERNWGSTTSVSTSPAIKNLGNRDWTIMPRVPPNEDSRRIVVGVHSLVVCTMRVTVGGLGENLTLLFKDELF